MAGSASIIAVGQLASVLKESITAQYFGVGRELDLVLVAMVAPNLFLLLIQNGLGSALIPAISRSEARFASPRVKMLILGKCYGIILLGFLVSLVLYTLRGKMLKFVASELTVLETNKVLNLMGPLAALPFLTSISASFGAVAATRGDFVLGNLHSIILNLCIIVTALCFGKTIGAKTIVLGTIIAYAFHAVLVFYWANKKYFYRIRPCFSLESLLLVGRISLPIITVMLFQQVVVVVERMTALELGQGAISSLNYAGRLTSFIPTFLGTSLCTVLLPHLSINHAAGNSDVSTKTINVLLRYTTLLSFSMAILIINFRTQIISLLLEGGRFQGLAIVETANPMVWLAVATPFQIAREILVRDYYSSHDSVTPMRLGVIRMIINVLFCVLLGKYFGTSGIALAYALALIAEVALMYWWKFDLEKTKQEIIFSSKILIMSIAGCVGAEFAYQCIVRIVVSTTKPLEAIILSTVFMIGIIATMIFSTALGCKESAELLKIVMKTGFKLVLFCKTQK